MSEFTGTIAVPCLDLMTVIVRIQNIEDRARWLVHYLRLYNNARPSRHFCHCLRCLIGLESTRANASDGEQKLYESIGRNKIVVLTIEPQHAFGCRRCQPHMHHPTRDQYPWRL